MCGIAGAAWVPGRTPLGGADLQGMLRTLTHRGPDDEGAAWFGANGDVLWDTGHDPNGRFDVPGERLASALAALGHRRLSIIDVAGGHQPIYNEDRSIAIVFNGEIYNYRELRDELAASGHRFRTRSDTEVIVHLYEERGVECLQRLRGMFAFALWDGRQSRLLLARDRLGQKPLLFRASAERLVFASELKALLALPDASFDVDPTSLDQYLLYGYVPHPRTILRAYEKLPPAHFAVYENGTLHVRRYWTPPFACFRDAGCGATPNHGEASPETAAEAGSGRMLDLHSGSRRDVEADQRTHRETAGQIRHASHAALVGETGNDDQWRTLLREVLTESVRLRLRSDVPLGAFLSGGIDSTIVVGLMQRLAGQTVQTFSIGFQEQRFDESAYARRAAESLGTDHHLHIVRPSVLEMLPRLAWHYDEPFADSSAIPTMYLSEITRRAVKVALTGDGGDELFGGYQRYLAARWAAFWQRLPVWSRRALALVGQVGRGAPTRSFLRRAYRFTQAFPLSVPERYLRWVGVCERSLRRQLLLPEVVAAVEQDAEDVLLTWARRCSRHVDPVTQAMCVDWHTYLPGDILFKVDIASMAHGLECRSPFLDHHVAELAARMPLRLKQSWRRGKRILIETFRDLLPPEIQRRGKMGFGVPLADWFRGALRDWLRDVLLASNSGLRNWFDPAAIERLIDEHQSGQLDHAPRLWALVALDAWHRTHLHASAPAARAK